MHEVRPFTHDELLGLVITEAALHERSPHELLATMSEEDADMCRRVAEALRSYFDRKGRIGRG